MREKDEQEKKPNHLGKMKIENKDSVILTSLLFLSHLSRHRDSKPHIQT